MKKLIPLFTSFLLISCSTYYGNLTGNTFTNQKIEATAIGSSSAKYVLGIGGNNRSALVLEAKKNLYENFPLKQNQNYSNFSVDFKNSFYFLFASQKVIVSADIVTINKGSNSQNETPNLIQNQFYPNDAVYVYSKLGKVISVDNNKVKVITDNDLKIKDYNKNDVFLINNRFQPEYEINATITYKVESSAYVPQYKNAKILAIGLTKILVEDQSDSKKAILERDIITK